MNIYFQIVLLLFTSILITSFFKRKSTIALCSILFGIFLTFQVASLLLSGNLIDFKFIRHLNFNDITFAGDFFLTETILLAFILFLAPIFIFYASLKWRSFFQKRAFISPVLLVFAFVILLLPNGMFRQLYEIIILKTAKDKSFEQSLEDLGISPSKYIFPDKLNAKAGKNIIVLSLESFEKGFLQDNLAHLSPNLRRLKEEMTFFDMPMEEGSSWTAGSIYTEITGVPAFFHSNNNSIFQQTSETKITGISHVLKKAGYEVTYLLAGKEFAGMGAMLKAYNFDVKSDSDYNYRSAHWGMHDKDLFEAAQKELLVQKKSGKPFALFISTVSTHAPEGIYDWRFEQTIKPQRSKLEFMAAAVDQLIGDFFNFLEKEGMMENTAIYIFPDHLLMGVNAEVIKDFAQPRSLYMMTNAKADQLSYSSQKKIYQIDLPKLILEGAEVEHNATFLTDFIQEQDKLAFLKKNQSNILAWNEAAVRRNNFKNGIEIEATILDKLLLKSDIHTERIAKVAKKDELYVFCFDKEYRLKKTIVAPNAFSAFRPKSEYLTLIVERKNGNIYAYLRKKGFIGMIKEGKNSVIFSKKDLQLDANWRIENKLSTLPAQPKYATPYDMIYLTSSGQGPEQVNTPSEIKIGTKDFPLKRGLNLLTKNNNGFEVIHFDTYDKPNAVRAMIEKVDELKTNRSFFALVAHESAGRPIADFGEVLHQRGFNLLPYLKHRTPYIAYSDRNIISEYTKAKTISISLPTHLPKNCSDKQLQQWANDPSRFIAHAGGQIEGHTYTNSLEALDWNYKNGLRLFELDIIKTFDGHYVAAHDWNSWKHKTKYIGTLPATKKEFLKIKIKDKFTPLDMEAINQWFTIHSDAILVTDKVNEPYCFCSTICR